MLLVPIVNLLKPVHTSSEERACPMRKLSVWKRRIAVGVTLIAVGFGLSFNTQQTGAITRGYNSDDLAIKPGLMVALSENSTPDNPKVERASRDQAERVIGVATTIDDSLVTIASSQQSVYVETSGEVDAYVVNLDGDVKRGDLLALSPIRGILTKATSYYPVVAIALEDFSREEAITYTIQDGSTTREVLIHRLNVNLDRKAVSGLTLQEKESALARLGRSIIGREVAEIRVVIALVIFFIVLIAEGSIIYGAISSAINSLGRNPLAKTIIKRELIRVLFVALAVLALGVLAIYGILWV
jgi:hypothetical protein